ncbi:MAG: histone deacetylase [Flavobacteriaceae bacterium]|nr:histone deacetylase [Flavobacteriaceae bacterium]|tara:strand:- start:1539 stop:2441 length:903 start_codon:yes stop_codon:yes gene_type:complete
MLKIAYNKLYNHPLEKNHRFPMLKYELIPEQLIRKNICSSINFFSNSEIKKRDAILTHDELYYDELINLSLSKHDKRLIGFPLTNDLVKREKIIAQGTIKNTSYALEYGISMNIAGGTHHAFKSKPGAFCMLNDQAIATNFLIENKICNRIMIIDLDVHQGNGTASIFENENSIFTVSFHGKKNYPFLKENSNFDLEFDDGTGDKEYLRELREKIPRLIDDFEPEFIFYLAGVDVLKNDKLGRLSLSIEGCKERDRFILNLCKTNNIPVQVSMGGGYSIHLKEIIDAHSNTFELAQEIYF